MAALCDCLVRIGRLADDVPQIAEMDLNPRTVLPRGVAAVDVKVRVAPAPQQPDVGVRRLH